MKPCPAFNELMTWQSRRLADLIDIAKWIESERIGNDCGRQRGEQLALTEAKFEEWRVEFCGSICSEKECKLGKRFQDEYDRI